MTHSLWLKYSILSRLNKKEWKMTLFAFTYANACTAMKGFDTDKNKKLEDEERSKLVYYIEVTKKSFTSYDSRNDFFSEYFGKCKCWRGFRQNDWSVRNWKTRPGMIFFMFVYNLQATNDRREFSKNPKLLWRIYFRVSTFWWVIPIIESIFEKSHTFTNSLGGFFNREICEPIFSALGRDISKRLHIAHDAKVRFLDICP